MSRTLKASKTVIASLFTLLLFVSGFVPIQLVSMAQVTKCPGNIVANGDFTNGLSSWTPYGTPDPSSAMGCQDPGAVGMWGNQNSSIGEGLQQTLSAVTGKTYVGSICFRRVNDPGKQPNAMFRLRVSPSVAPMQWGTTDTIYLSPNVTLTNWMTYNFTFVAPTNAPILTINVENTLSNNDGADTSYGQFDNVCIREQTPPDFTATTVCHGRATQFTSNTSGATSWDWDFGDNSPHGSGATPNHTYAHAGTYTVKLCINGTTNCVTKTVTVTPGPAPPVIIGPINACGPAIYSVQALPGFTYSWTVTNGTINGSSTSNTLNVTWNSTGLGTVSVTASSHGCTSEPATLTVHTCNVNAGDCCLQFQSKTDLAAFTYISNGVYNVTPNLSTTAFPGVIQVTADIISASVSYSTATCGTSGPVNAYVVGASNVVTPIFNASVTVLNGDEAIWKGSPANVGGVNFPMQIKFPPPPSGHCQDFLSFCIKYTFTDSHCKTCAVIRCYGPFKRGGGPIIEDGTTPADPTRIVPPKL